jgi:hypothetical protein
MHEGASITLSADAAIFTVWTRIPSGGVFCFSFDGTFWIYDEAAAAQRALVSTNSAAAPVAAQLLCLDVAASISHSGAVHEFLLLHFRLGHLNYTAMLRALQAGTWTGFHHHPSGATPVLSGVCLRMKNKHLPISNVGRFVQPRPGLLCHMDLKTVRTRSINHEHYIVDIIDDNSDKPWVYYLRKKSDAFPLALQVFVNTVCKPRGLNYFALRIDNAGELTSHEVPTMASTSSLCLPIAMRSTAWPRNSLTPCWA